MVFFLHQLLNCKPILSEAKNLLCNKANKFEIVRCTQDWIISIYSK